VAAGGADGQRTRSAIQAAQLRLAHAVLAAAPNGPMEVERIEADALKAVRAGPGA